MAFPVVVQSDTYTSTWTDPGTHSTDSGGAFSSGPTESVVSAKGRAAGTASTANTVRRHHSSGFNVFSTSQGGEVYVEWKRNQLSVWPMILAYVNGDDCVAVQLETLSGKSTTYNLSIQTCTSGTWTTRLNSPQITAGGTVGNTFGMRVRFTPHLGGNLIVQSKIWRIGSSEPAFLEPSFGGFPGAAGTYNYASSTDFAQNSYVLANGLWAQGFYGFAEEHVSTAVAHTVDYDNYEVKAINATVTAATTLPGPTATATAATVVRANYASNWDRWIYANSTGTLPGWTLSYGAIGRSGGLSASTTPAQMLYDTGDTDHRIDPDIVYVADYTSNLLAIFTRYTDSSNHVKIVPYWDGISTYELQLIKGVAGVFTTVATIPISHSYSVINRWSLKAEGTTFTVEGITQVPRYTARYSYEITDAAVQTGTKVGLWWNTGSPSFYSDDVSVGWGTLVGPNVLPSPTGTASATVGGGGPATVNAVIATTLDAPTATATATVEHPATATTTLPGPTATASVGVTVSAVAATTLPGPIATAAATTVSFITAVGSSTLTSPTATASALVAHDATIATALPGPVGAAIASTAGFVTATISTTLNGLVGTAAATVAHPAVAAAALPSPVATASATVTPVVTATGTAILGAPVGTAAATVKHPAVAAITLASPSATAITTVRKLAVAVGTLQGPLTVTTALVTVHATAGITLVAPSATAQGIVISPVDSTDADSSTGNLYSRHVISALTNRHETLEIEI